MPGRDQTGPSGSGPTGHRAGPCANAEYGIGDWAQRRQRRFWSRHHWPAPVSPAEEKEFLEAEQNWLQKRIDAISKRLQELP